MRWMVALGLSILATVGVGQTRYVLRYTDSVPLGDFLQRYSLTLAGQVSGQPIYDVRDPLLRPPAELLAQMDDDHDEDVVIEPDQTVRLPALSFPAPIWSGSGDLLTAFAQSQIVSFFGSPAPLGFMRQPALQLTRADLSWASHGLGTGIVAVIDTGIDPSHPFFAGYLEPGVDLLNPTGAASELQGLSPDALALVNPTTTPILERRFQQWLGGIAPLVDRRPASSLGRLNSLPVALGHGTMVAGAVRLVAPRARILPIRAFNTSGTGRLFDILQGLYAARSRGARILNMSFNLYQYSPELDRSLELLADGGMVLVASTGNDGRIGVFSMPASFPKVVGVASVDRFGFRSTFSNAGPGMADLGAPGEALYLPFPGGRWAGGWGTSFAAPQVAGLAAKILERQSNATVSELLSAIGHSSPTADANLGGKTLDVQRILTSW